MRTWLYYLNVVLRVFGIVVVRKMVNRETRGFFVDWAVRHPYQGGDK